MVKPLNNPSSVPFAIVTRKNGYSVVDHPGSVAVIPVLNHDSSVLPRRTDDSLILLCSQNRAGPEANVIEIPAGTCDVTNEILSETGIREMEEEVGYSPSHYTYLGNMLPSPGYCSEVIHLYLAWGLIECKGEREFEPIVMSVGNVLGQISAGSIIDAKTIVALTMWQLLEVKIMGKLEIIR